MPVVKIVVLLCTSVLSACNALPLGVGCTDSVERALEVEVQDAASGAYIAAGASGWARDGDFFEHLKVVGWRGYPPNDTVTTLGGVYERSGRYEVVITHPGYQMWTRKGVRVSKDTCHVRTVRLTAQLIRQS